MKVNGIKGTKVAEMILISASNIPSFRSHGVVTAKFNGLRAFDTAVASSEDFSGTVAIIPT